MKSKKQGSEVFCLKNGRVIDPANGRDEVGDILIRDGQIVPIGSLGDKKADKVIDATGLIVVPGLIDMHVHLRQPGGEHKETIYSGTRAAAKGGFTTVACMPNTQPVVDNVHTLKMVLDEAKRNGLVNVSAIAGITKNLAGQELTDMRELLHVGAVAFSDDGKTVMNAELMRRTLMLSAAFDFPVIPHCEDVNLSAGGVMNRGEVAAKLNLPGMPNLAEDVIVARDIILAEATGGYLHIAHVSTARSVDLVREAKRRGANVTAEVTPHHFTLTDSALEGATSDFARANAKMNPPLRTQADVDAVIAGLRDGTIDAIATDHAPHAEVEKALGILKAPCGIVGLETCLPLVISQLVEPGHLTLPEAISKLTRDPAKILRLDKGTLSVGSDADITLIDPKKEAKVETSTFVSKSRNTPFAGWTLRGWAVMAIRDGKIISNDILEERP